MKKPNKKKLIKKADKLWSEIIRSKGRCEVCGRTDTLNAHHIVSRSNHYLRHETRNGVCLCALHHVFGNQSAHKDPLWFYDWLDSYRKIDLAFLKKEKIKDVGGLSIQFYLEQIAKLDKEKNSAII